MPMSHRYCCGNAKKHNLSHWSVKTFVILEVTPQRQRYAKENRCCCMATLSPKVFAWLFGGRSGGVDRSEDVM